MSEDPASDGGEVANEWLPELDSPPEGWVVLDVVAVMKGLDADGQVTYWSEASEGLQQVEAVGMLRSALLAHEAEVATWFDSGDEDEDELP